MGNFLVIGGSSGIGNELVKRLSDKGQKVWATYNENKIDSTSDYSFEHLDVLDENLNLDFVPEVLDGLVYCPGSINLKPFTRIKEEDFVADFRLQVLGAIKVIKAVLPNLKKSTNPSIVLFSTVAVQNGFPFHSQVSTSKGAIEGLTRSLAAELAPRIRVNCIAPSLTDTPLASKILSSDERKESNAQRHPLKRIGNVGDIASMADFILGEDASWLTGQIFHVDGGMSSLKV